MRAVGKARPGLRGEGRAAAGAATPSGRLHSSIPARPLAIRRSFAADPARAADRLVALLRGRSGWEAMRHA